MTIENIKELMDGVDIAALLPDLEKLVAALPSIMRFLVLLGPVVLLFLGLHYFLLAPKEANYTTGYRFHWGMASPDSWRFMQQVAGAAWTLLGLGLLIAMAISSAGFGQLETMDLLWTVVKNLALQAGLTLVSCLLIDVIVVLRYDYKGRRRLTWRDVYEDEPLGEE